MFGTNSCESNVILILKNSFCNTVRTCMVMPIKLVVVVVASQKFLHIN